MAMSKWLERARREITKNAGAATAIAAKRDATAVPSAEEYQASQLSFGSIGSCPSAHNSEIDTDARSAVTSTSCGEPKFAHLATYASGADVRELMGERIRGAKPASPTALTADQEASIRAWLSHINETDTAIIAHVLDHCRMDAEVRGYFIRQAEEVGISPVEEITRANSDADDRRRCTDCSNLTPGGRCLAARRGELAATRIYKPVPDILRRCEGYSPKATDTDQRPGHERWPGLSEVLMY